MTNRSGNFISTFEGALSSEFCDQIIDKFEASPQSHIAGKIGAGVNVEKKDSISDEGSTKGGKKEFTPEEYRAQVQAKRDIPQGLLLLKQARIITMKGDEIIENGDIGSRIGTKRESNLN